MLGPNGLYYPNLTIEVAIKNRPTLSVAGILDSGADRTILPRSLLPAVQIDWDSLPLVKGPMDSQPEDKVLAV